VIDEDRREDEQQTAARAARRARRIGGHARSGAGAPLPVETAVTPVESAAPPIEAAAPPPDEPGAAESVATADPEGAEGAGQAAGPSWLLRWLPALAVALVCLGLLGYGLVDSRGVWWDAGSSSVAGERGAVLAAAKTCMARMNTYDYRTLDSDEKKGLACTTGTFSGQYKQAFEKLIKPDAATATFTQTAQINNAGVESVSGNGKQWVILVYGQLSTTNKQTGTKTPTLTAFGARVTMQQAAGKWLVANYQYAPNS
jgi:Mce-associated membrane protein